VLAALEQAPIYLTIDIDGLDPACAPGTGCPEPGGATFAEVMGLIAALARCDVVGVDVMEVLPAVDTNDITSVAAAKLVREMALAFARRTPQRGTRDDSQSLLPGAGASGGGAAP
jgi:agmatinase